MTRRNRCILKVVLSVIVYLAASTTFYTGSATTGSTELARRLGFARKVMLIFMFGGSFLSLTATLPRMIVPTLTGFWITASL